MIHVKPTPYCKLVISYYQIKFLTRRKVPALFANANSADKYHVASHQSDHQLPESLLLVSSDETLRLLNIMVMVVALKICETDRRISLSVSM